MTKNRRKMLPCSIVCFAPKSQYGQAPCTSECVLHSKKSMKLTIMFALSERTKQKRDSLLWSTNTTPSTVMSTKS